MSIIGLDYGSRTVGVAVTDALGLTVQPLETIERKEENKLRRTYARIEELAKERNAELIVVGLPLNIDGTEGERSLLARQFSEKLSARTGLPVCLQDERLTTVEADEILAECGRKRETRKEVIDQLAACLILRDYLEQWADELRKNIQCGLPQENENG